MRLITLMAITIILFCCLISTGDLSVSDEPKYDISVSKTSDGATAVNSDGKVIISDTDETYVIQQAFNSLPDEGIISFDNSEYDIFNTASVVGKNFTMQGNNTKFNIDVGKEKMPGFYFAGSAIVSAKVSIDALKGSDVIKLDNTTGAREGDLVLVFNDIKWSPDDNPQLKTGELYAIKSVSGDTVELNSKLVRDYTTGLNSEVIIYRPATVKIKGCTFIGTGDSDPVSGVSLQYCKNSKILDCFFDKNGLAALSLYTCYEVEVSKNKILNSNMPDLGYGVQILNACTNITVKDNDIRKCKHCVTSGSNGDVNGVNKDIYILDNFLYSGIGDVVDSHPYTINYEVTNNTIYSGPYAAFCDGTQSSNFSDNKVYGAVTITTRGHVPNYIKKITGNYIEGNSLIYEDTISVGDLTISNNKIMSNIMNDSTEVIFLINMSINNLIITNNTINSGKKGIFVDIGNISNTTISNNYIENVQKGAIIVDSINNVNVYENTIKNANLEDGEYCSIDLINAKHANIYRNKISSDRLQTGYGIAEDSQCDNNYIYGNWIENMSLGAVDIRGPNSIEKDNEFGSNIIPNDDFSLPPKSGKVSMQDAFMDVYQRAVKRLSSYFSVGE